MAPLLRIWPPSCNSSGQSRTKALKEESMNPISANNNFYLDQYIPAEEPVAENSLPEGFEEYAAYEDYLGSEKDFDVVGENDSGFGTAEGGYSEDVFVQGAGSAEGGSVTAKIEQLEAALDQSSIEGSQRKEIEAELKALHGRLNYS